MSKMGRSRSLLVYFVFSIQQEESFYKKTSYDGKIRTLAALALVPQPAGPQWATVLFIKLPLIQISVITIDQVICKLTLFN